MYFVNVYYLLMKFDMNNLREICRELNGRLLVFGFKYFKYKLVILFKILVKVVSIFFFYC